MIEVQDRNRVSMSQRERDVLKVMQPVLDGKRTQAEAARLLKRSIRQVHTFDGYRTAVSATKVVVTDNVIHHFQGAAVILKDGRKPAHVTGNTVTSDDPKAKVIDVQGPSGVVEGNALKPVEKK